MTNTIATTATTNAHANANATTSTTTSTTNASTTTSKSDGNGQHRNKGRAARRRKAKVRSIQLALEALLSGQDMEEFHESCRKNDESLLFSLPADRSHTSPGVLQRRKERNLKLDNFMDLDKDQPLLVSQLGYMPGNAVGVVGRVQDLEHLYPCLYQLLCHVDKKRGGMTHGGSCVPTVLQLYPLAVRNVFVGGKAEGRKFKSRKRGLDEGKRNNMPSDGIQHGIQDDDNKKWKDEQLPSPSPLPFESQKSESSQSQQVQLLEEPFPTMYWLTHPFLKTLVSQLEIGSTDNVIEMQKRLASSEESLLAMKLAHECYARQRWDLLTEQDKQRITAIESHDGDHDGCDDDGNDDDNEGKDEKKKTKKNKRNDGNHVKKSFNRKWIADAIGSERGVAGIRKFDTVKCLHTHAAHYLAFLAASHTGNKPDFHHTMKENLVGKWVLQSLEAVAKDMKPV